MRASTHCRRPGGLRPRREIGGAILAGLCHENEGFKQPMLNLLAFYDSLLSMANSHSVSRYNDFFYFFPAFWGIIFILKV